MIPAGVHELLAADPTLAGLGITSDRIIEAQSVDGRPFTDGYFVVTDAGDQDIVPHLRRGPRTVTLAVHHGDEFDRDCRPIDRILAQIKRTLAAVEQHVGPDGIRITDTRLIGVSGNLRDERWRTVYRTITVSILYTEPVAL